MALSYCQKESYKRQAVYMILKSVSRSTKKTVDVSQHKTRFQKMKFMKIIFLFTLVIVAINGNIDLKLHRYG